jgi:hypothetical protein
MENEINNKNIKSLYYPITISNFHLIEWLSKFFRKIIKLIFLMSFEFNDNKILKNSIEIQ